MTTDPGSREVTLVDPIDRLVSDGDVGALAADLRAALAALGELTRTNQALGALLRQVEAAVDATPELTRAGREFPRVAQFRFDESGWSVHLDVRNRRARGRGSRGVFGAMGSGESPEEAVASFLERIPYVVQATS